MSLLINGVRIDEMRKLKHLMHTCAFIVEVMATIFPGPLLDMQPHITNNCRNLFVLFRQAYFICFNICPIKFQHYLLDQCRFVIHHQNIIFIHSPVWFGFLYVNMSFLSLHFDVFLNLSVCFPFTIFPSCSKS